MKAQQEEIEAEIKAENEQLLRKVEEFIRSNDKFVVTIQNNSVVEVKYPMDETMLYNLAAEDPIWQQLADEKYSADQVYRFYQRALRMRKKKKVPKQVVFEELPLRNRKSQYSRPKLIKKRKQQCTTGGFKIRIPREAVAT